MGDNVHSPSNTHDRMRRPDPVQQVEADADEEDLRHERSSVGMPGAEMSNIGHKLLPEEWMWGPEFLHEEFTDPHGEPDSGLFMQPVFMNRLLALRRRVGHPIFIHANGGFSSKGHAEGSAHYIGLAADFHVPHCPPSRLARHIRSVNFDGVGFYERWKPMAGFHLDMAERRARWVRMESGEYVSLT